MAKKILKGLGSVAKFAVGGLIGSSLFSKSKKKAPAVAAPVEKPMPLADDEAVRLARRKSMAMQRQRGGRTSTILTGDSDGGTLGGGS